MTRPLWVAKPPLARNLYKHSSMLSILSAFLLSLTSLADCGTPLDSIAYHGQEIQLGRSIFQTQNTSFVPHQADGAFSNYLAMAIPLDPVKHVFDAIRQSGYPGLKSRGEAHITVVNPVEFQHLKNKISMDEIDAIAAKMAIQNTAFEILGLGSARALVNGKIEETFFLVVRSPELLKIREQVLSRFLELGGAPGQFIPAQYTPHITVGFTLRDLQESDHVVKGPSSLDPRYDLKIN